MQSADGQVMIPSFHRPAAIRYDPNGVAGTAINDWQSNTTDSMARILRPRQYDGNDPNTFPDLVPNASGWITYDVDNDGDGLTDSVWVDLGYPARRNAQGQLYKPLFAFMVIGLNGRIPLNTAGNLAGGRGTNPSTHAAHLGNSVSEIDPTYGLQNGFVFATDAAGAFSPQVYGGPYNANNTQVDNSATTYPPALDVRLIQLRNLLAGTRPQTNPGVPGLTHGTPDTTGQINGDINFVLMGAPPNAPFLYFMPNGIADIGDVDGYGATPPTAVFRLTPPVAGRWGEAQSVPGYPKITNPNPPPPLANLVVPTYSNPIRAGYSEDIGDLLAGTARDAADDNLNSFDPYPPFTPTYNRLGEVNDLDFLDPAGAFLLPVERIRRYVTPADINGTGRVLQYNNGNYSTTPLANGTTPLANSDVGADQWGRVVYYSYFRPPGLPGQVTPTPPGTSPSSFTTPVIFPWTSGEAYPNTLLTNVTTGALAGSLVEDNNPLHGFDAQRFPNLNYTVSFIPQRAGGVPFDQNPNPSLSYLPGTLPTYNAQSNAKVNSDGLNEADEMNLYVPNAQLDAPFGYGDLEWLYRQQDVDGSSLVSRLAQLAPVSFSNPVDGQRRRRLYALDSWETNNFVWANDNPGSVFPNNRSFTATQDASFGQLSTNLGSTYPTPSLAHRDKKINLNYPLPVSNDPNEPVRQKWISDTYYTLKAILPPLAVDSAEELAQLSQYVINIIDFRDPDATMTHWRNPDVYLRTSTAGASPFPVLAAAYNSTTDVFLDQYGMEYNPIAINEVMAYSFASAPQTNRFFIELVNTLTSPELGTPAAAGLGLAPNTGTNNASVLDLAGFQSNPSPPAPATPPATPWDGGCWDLIVTDDLPQSRPDPVLGQLQPGGNYYGLLPLSTWSTGGSMTQNPAAALPAPAGDPSLFPLPQSMPPGGSATLANLFLGYFGTPPLVPNNPQAPVYFTTIGNPTPANNVETNPFQPTYVLNTSFDPVNTGTPPGNVPAGVIPPTAINATPSTTYSAPALKKIPNLVAGSGTGAMYWVCLRRPANPFAPVSAQNPMIVVDAMRFPYIESGGTPGTPGNSFMFSYQRLQPFRGGHAVPMPGVTGNAIDPRYGYSEQIAVPCTPYTNLGQTGSGGQQITGTGKFYHTLGGPNDAGGTQSGWNPGAAGIPPTGPPYTTPPIPPSLVEPWDYFTFNDRDFTSVAELLLVPGCPPGLFTKRFAEFAPSAANVTNIFSQVTPLPSGPSAQYGALPLAPVASPAPAVQATASIPFNATVTTPLTPHAFPYLVDKFFYTAASPATVPTNATFGDQTGDGWFKMFEFFEVPSQMIGAVGPVAQGTDFDWLRQDTKPGLINLNLIIDEEVFCSVFGLQDSSFTQRLLNFSQLPPQPFPGASIVQSPGTFNATAATASTLPMVAGQSPVPMVVTATTFYGSPAAAYPMTNVGVLATDPATPTLRNRMKAAFAQFLSLRHGGSGYVFGYGSGLPGQNMTVLTGNANGPTTPALAMVSPIPADRPFHSVSYPDIDYTIMRPAALPPFNYPTMPVTSTDPPPNTPATSWPPYYNASGATSYTADPGLRNSMVYQGFTSASLIPAPNTGTTPQSTPTTSIAAANTVPFLLPPAIPPRRLFQPPDSFWSTTATTPPYPANTITASNASDTGDPYLNNLVPVNATAAIGALPPFTGPTPTNNVVNLFWPAGTTLPTAVPATTPPTIPSPYLGANSVTGPPLVPDMKQHPYFRTEMLQKAMNLTTERTHQYAVWITIGFFEVARQGDLLMIQQGNPVLAYDMLGPEIGASTGQTTRYRGFFLVDRLKLYSFDDTTPGSFRPAVVYRQTIE